MKRNLSQWLAYLESLHPKGQKGIELGLERVGRVKAQLGQRAFCPVIVVGGTNGKGRPVPISRSDLSCRRLSRRLLYLTASTRVQRTRLD